MNTIERVSDSQAGSQTDRQTDRINVLDEKPFSLVLYKQTEIERYREYFVVVVVVWSSAVLLIPMHTERNQIGFKFHCFWLCDEPLLFILKNCVCTFISQKMHAIISISLDSNFFRCFEKKTNRNLWSGQIFGQWMLCLLHYSFIAG